MTIALWPRWLRWWFELEDPRPLARLRIVFSLLLLLDVAGLHEQYEMLFDPNGLFTAAQARAHWGRGGDGVLDAAIAFITGRFSILFYWDAPHAFDVVLGSFVVSTVLFMAGFRTRLFGVLTLLLFESILNRNHVWWASTEAVFLVFLVYLICSRCGEALSVDAWQRRRRDPDAPPALVPAWPRRLMMVQLSILLVVTGLLKHGGAWLDGDAVYYALSLEHYARFRPQRMLALVGPTGIGVLTVFARSVEVFFPFVLVGVVRRWSAVRFAPLHGKRRVVVYVALLVTLAMATLAALVTGAPRLLLVDSRPLAAVTILVVVGGTAWVWGSERGKSLRWLYDRRLWLGAAAALFTGMWLFMDIGLFHPAMLATLLVFVAEEPPPSTPLAYAPRTRAIGGALLAWHLAAIGMTAFGSRTAANVVTRPWMLATRTNQHWGMFGRPPHENQYVKAIAVDDNGRRTDLHFDPYTGDPRPPSPVGYDRAQWISERTSRTRRRGRLPKALARWQCRQHPDAVRIELYVVTIPIPTPQENTALGGYDPDTVFRERATERRVLNYRCL